MNKQCLLRSTLATIILGVIKPLLPGVGNTTHPIIASLILLVDCHLMDAAGITFSLWMPQVSFQAFTLN